jgi:predicted O-methyltransferase YrrM
MEDIIRKKMGVQRVAEPPILCWIGTGRHNLGDPNTGRKLLAELFADLKFKVGAEIGVDRGVFSDMMLSANPDLTLHLVDAWDGPKAGEHCIDAHRRLDKYGERAQFKRFKSLVAAKQFEDNSLDFVYIDSQRDFNAVSMDLIEWGRRVKQGGLITGRGYCNLFETGVVKAVDAYTLANNLRAFYITRAIEPEYILVKHWKSV